MNLTITEPQSAFERDYGCRLDGDDPADTLTPVFDRTAADITAWERFDELPVHESELVDEIAVTWEEWLRTNDPERWVLLGIAEQTFDVPDDFEVIEWPEEALHVPTPVGFTEIPVLPLDAV